jgi:hypothetical protein
VFGDEEQQGLVRPSFASILKAIGAAVRDDANP